MGFMSDISRLMKVATKPDRSEIWLVTKVTALGMSALGLLGFIIKLAGDVLSQGLRSSSGTTTTGAAGAGLFIQIAAMLLYMLK